MSDLLENINRYIVGREVKPKVSDFTNITDKLMDTTLQMERFLNNIDDAKKRESMKRNISMIQQMIVDNMESYNEWLQKKSREQG